MILNPFFESAVASFCLTVSRRLSELRQQTRVVVAAGRKGNPKRNPLATVRYYKNQCGCTQRPSWVQETNDTIENETKKSISDTISVASTAECVLGHRFTIGTPQRCESRRCARIVSKIGAEECVSPRHPFSSRRPPSTSTKWVLCVWRALVCAPRTELFCFSARIVHSSCSNSYRTALSI